MTPSTPARTDAGALADELTEDQVMKVIRDLRMSESIKLTVTVWKDGIDIYEPSFNTMRFANALVKAAALRNSAPQETRGDEPVVSIKPMELSDNRIDYFVSIKVGDREVTPHVFRDEYKAAYHVTLYDWLLNGSGEEPDIVAFGPYDWPARILAAHPQETRTDEPAAREACDWPRGDFTFHDEPGEHDPCYVIMPGGAMLSLNHHAGEGVDIARAKYIVAACNAALTGGLPLSPAQIQLIVTEAMLDCWNDICSDTDCHPLDIEHHGGKKLGFHVGHWARQTGAQVAAALAASQQSPQLERDKLLIDPRLTVFAENAARRIARAEQLDNVSATEIYRTIIEAIVSGCIALQTAQDADALLSPDTTVVSSTDWSPSAKAAGAESEPVFAATVTSKDRGAE